MPAVNEYVNYGCQGICKIEDLRFMKFGSVGHDYFVLKPVHQENASIFVPADNQNLLARMRPILAPKQQAKTCMPPQTANKGNLCSLA